MPPKKEIPNAPGRIYMPEELWNFVAKQANSLNLTKSDYVKKIIEEEIEREEKKKAQDTNKI